MFQTGEIVLYRLILARVSEIQKENGSVRYLLTSLESDDCSYEVPAENRLGHLQALPDVAKIRTLFQDLASDPGVRIARNAVDRCCKAVLEPYALKQWLSLLKTLYIDKTAAEMAGRKFVESEKRYYGIITERLITILSAALDQSPKQSEAMLNAALEAGTQEG